MPEDLTIGTDCRGDHAFFIEESHFSPDGSLDEEAKDALGDGLHFFRLLRDGEQAHTHGWIENGEVIQWG